MGLGRTSVDKVRATNVCNSVCQCAHPSRARASCRSYWHCFSDETKAIVYVVDSADKARLGLTKRELHSLLDADELQNAKLLVLANKQDLAGAASPAEVSDALALDSLRDRSWTIIPTVATEGKGIEEGMDWCVLCLAV